MTEKYQPWSIKSLQNNKEKANNPYPKMDKGYECMIQRKRNANGQ